MNFQEKPINRTEIKYEKPNFSEQLSSYLNSGEFKEKILEFEPDQRQDVFGSVIEYSILHKDNYQLEEFIQELKSLDKNIWGNASFNQNLVKMMIKSVASKFELKQPMSKEDEKIAFDYVVENFIVDGYYFHGFNGVFEESIEEHGLSPKTRNWDVEELREISTLGSKHGVETILGWHSLNSEDKSFIDHHPFNTYRYATNSPEWFGQFVGESHWVNDNGKNNKTAFVRKDYAAAKENVVTRCKDMKLDEQETDKLMAFFEKYWAIFATEKAKPKVALIKTTAISTIDNIKSFNNYEELEKLVEEFAIKTRSPKQPEEVLELLLSSHIMPNDQGLEEVIKPEDIQIANLPEYNEIYPRKGE